MSTLDIKVGAWLLTGRDCSPLHAEQTFTQHAVILCSLVAHNRLHVVRGKRVDSAQQHYGTYSMKCSARSRHSSSLIWRPCPAGTQKSRACVQHNLWFLVGQVTGFYLQSCMSKVIIAACSWNLQGIMCTCQVRKACRLHPFLLEPIQQRIHDSINTKSKAVMGARVLCCHVRYEVDQKLLEAVLRFNRIPAITEAADGRLLGSWQWKT